MMLERVVDQAVQVFPAGPGFDGDDGDPQRGRTGDRGLGGFLDEDRRRPPVMVLEPVDGLGAGYAEQEDQIG